VLQLGQYNYDYEYWNNQIPNLNPFPFDSKVIWNKMWQYSLARFGEIYKDPVVASDNIHLYTYANVVDIVSNESVNSVDHVVIKNYEGKTHTVNAGHFILACGAIQNARMLLASNRQIPQGLGNEYDVVGRYFMEHIEVDSSEIWLIEPFPTDLYTWDFGETKASAELAITEDVQRQYRILNGTASFSPLSFKRLTKPTMELWSDEDPRKSVDNLLSHWAEAAEKAAENNTGAISRAFSLMTRIEQAPNPNSRVTLLDEKDELGVPKVNLNWELTELDKYSIRKIHSIIGQQAGAAGIGRVKLNEFLWDEKDDLTWPNDTKAGWHHMGTTRMGADPRISVVDQNCKVHSLSNLYVAGSGCYTTSAAPNPTLTLTALSLRLSDHLKKKIEAV
jgi:choline dehydrogenase-like flavoprotein